MIEPKLDSQISNISIPHPVAFMCYGFALGVAQDVLGNNLTQVAAYAGVGSSMLQSVFKMNEAVKYLDNIISENDSYETVDKDIFKKIPRDTSINYEVAYEYFEDNRIDVLSSMRSRYTKGAYVESAFGAGIKSSIFCAIGYGFGRLVKQYV